jgi:uncharacterized DUF497 family protein
VPRIEIDAVEWNAANEDHATRHGVSVREIEAILGLVTVASKNRKGRSGDYYADGVTPGGRRIRVVFAYRPGTRTARPITAWEVDR